MRKSLIFTVLFLAVCNGQVQTPILDALISGASRIRNRLQNAGSFIESLTHGGALNIGGSFGINNEPPPPPHQPGPNGYGPGPNGYGPRQDGYGTGQNGYRPGQDGYGPGPNGYGHGHDGYGTRPNGYGPGPNSYGPRPDGNGLGPNGNGPGPNGYGPGHPVRPGYSQGPNNQYQNNGPNYGQNNQNYENDQNQQIAENTKQENMPNYNNGNDNKKPSVYGQTSQGGTKNDDGPIHVPLLNPNEVNYGVDKTEINAPKRETSQNNEAADDDQEYNIDVRFSNE